MFYDTVFINTIIFKKKPVLSPRNKESSGNLIYIVLLTAISQSIEYA